MPVTREEFRQYCLAKKGVTEEFPFAMPVAVFKVQGKMFALADTDFRRINLKCDPVMAIELRERYRGVTPGYHMNKRHWNSIAVDGSLDDRLVYGWVDHSYDLVVSKLPRAQREELEAL
jgi:predicted DNA-binding protein (MmcQ/YjbR family)